jgi:two-component system chemotaxis response regulator CheB
VVRLLEHSGRIPNPSLAAFEKPRRERAAANAAAPSAIVVIGASTGGPLALRELLGELPSDLSAAVLVVQHLPKSFTGALAAQLRRYCGLEVREAEDGDQLHPGLVLVAPGGYHLVARHGMRVSVQSGPEIGGHCPSIDVTMESAAYLYGSRVAGVVLTGMGEDGTNGLRAIRAKGGTTFAQEAQSCVVNGMPQSAVDAGVVDHLGSPVQIGNLLAVAYKASEKGAYAAQL